MAKTKKAETWRNRIVGHGFEDPRALLANPKNWRIHPENQREALAGALDAVGWVDEITVNRRTGFVLDGHARAALAIERGEIKVPTRYVDLSEAEEALMLAAKDPMAGLAIADQQKLNDLLGDVDVTNRALDQMLSSLLEETTAGTLVDEPEDTGGDGRGQLDRSGQIRPVLYADQIALFEQAIRLTGQRNRGKAIMAICQAYVDQYEEAAGQFNLPREGAIA